ncbi:MAG: hypothetical protein UHD05_05950 [Ruminococcus sp.]|nr:hypothetical protein [Ruminococcus sp.]
MNNNITNFVINTPFRTMTNEYTYGEDNLLTEFNINKERTVRQGVRQGTVLCLEQKYSLSPTLHIKT